MKDQKSNNQQELPYVDYMDDEYPDNVDTARDLAEQDLEKYPSMEFGDHTGTIWQDAKDTALDTAAEYLETYIDDWYNDCRFARDLAHNIEDQRKHLIDMVYAVYFALDCNAELQTAEDLERLLDDYWFREEYMSDIVMHAVDTYIQENLPISDPCHGTGS